MSKSDKPVENAGFSPMKYDPEKHRSALRDMFGTVFSVDDTIADAEIDYIAAKFEEQQLERVRESINQGVGLEAFCDPDARIQIKKGLRERIESVILILGDAWVYRNHKANLPFPDAVDTTARAAAHAAHDRFKEGDGNPYECIGMMMDAFIFGREAKDIPGVTIDGFDPDVTWKWAQTLRGSKRDGMAFILNIWNSNGPWGQLDIVRAWSRWDAIERGVVQGWLDKPWWP